jgi:hypothetical protein
VIVPATGSSHRPPRRWRRTIVALATVAVLVLVAGELAARALDAYLPEPVLWHDAATQAKVAQMDTLAAPASGVDVVVAGNSMARDAFVPERFIAADPGHRSAYNASLDAASPALLDRWVGEEVEPRLRPATFVLALASLDVNGNARAGQAARAGYDDAPLSRPGAAGDLEAALVRRSALLQHREQLRDLGALWSAADRLRAGEAVPRDEPPTAGGVLGRLGEGRTRQRLRYRGPSAGTAFLTSQLLNDFQMDDVLFSEERALIDRLRAAGADVVVVVLPVTADYQDLHPGGSATFARFLDRVRQLGAEAGVPVVDLHDQAALDGFADTHHLNGAGAEAFSAALPGVLDRAGVPVRRCGP